MQQLLRAPGHAGADLLDHGALSSAPLTAADYPEDWLIRQQLDEARALAGNDELKMARILCAEVVFDHMLRLAGNRELLCLAIATLIQARGFQLLGRLLQAVDGRRVRVVLGDPATGAASPPHLISHAQAQGVTTFTLCERLYSDPSRDAVIDRLSADLALGRPAASTAA